MFTKFSELLTFLLLCVTVTTTHDVNNFDYDDESKNDKRTDTVEMPSNWPNQWDTGVIPFVYDYYSANPKTFIKIVHKGQDVIKQSGCLKFQEHNPIELATWDNFTYLYYSYSGVLEECCGTYFNKDVGRRLVLITPKCRNPGEVAHATLHALGLTHDKKQHFSQSAVDAVLNPKKCKALVCKKNSTSPWSSSSLEVSGN